MNRLRTDLETYALMQRLTPVEAFNVLRSPDIGMAGIFFNTFSSIPYRPEEVSICTERHVSSSLEPSTFDFWMFFIGATETGV
jgi:hypothetical protein